MIFTQIHIFIIFALNNITTALEFMRNEEVSLLPKMAFLIGSLMMYYVFLFFTAEYAKVRCRLDWKFLLGMGGFGVVFAALMLLLRENMYVNIALTAAAVFGVFALLRQAKADITSEA